MEHRKITKSEAATVLEVMKAIGCDRLTIGRIGFVDMTDYSHVGFFFLLPKMVGILSNYSCNSGDAKLVEDVTKFLSYLGDVCKQVVLISDCYEVLNEIDNLLQVVHDVYNDSE